MMTVKPGTIGLCAIPGKLGWVIARGQSLIGSPSAFTHAFMVLDDERVIQAMPSGAEYAPLAPFLEPGAAIFLRGWYGLTAADVKLIRLRADKLIGTPYNFADYLALAWPGRTRPDWLTRYVQSDRSMICSQLVDDLCRYVGVHLFSDGRHPSSVSPGDLHTEWSRYVGAA